MKNNQMNMHVPVMLNEIKNFIPLNKKINLIDATFGGGGYSKFILESYNVENLIAIDRDPISKTYSNNLKKKYPNKFKLINGCFSKIDELVDSIKLDSSIKKKFDVIVFDLGLSSNQLEDSSRGFSFNRDGPLNMNMGESKVLASDIINKFSEKEIADIIFNFGEESYAKKISKKIIEHRKHKIINSTLELAELIKKSIPFSQSKNRKINPATKTFQALRIYVNDELNELKIALNKSQFLLAPSGKLLVVSFQSLEDKIVKDCFNHKSGKKRRSSRHYPDLAEQGPITLKLITKKPLRPDESEIKLNFRSRSAKLRVAEKILQEEY